MRRIITHGDMEDVLLRYASQQVAACVHHVRALCASCARVVCVMCARCVRYVRTSCALCAHVVCVMCTRRVRKSQGNIPCVECLKEQLSTGHMAVYMVTSLHTVLSVWTNAYLYSLNQNIVIAVKFLNWLNQYQTLESNEASVSIKTLLCVISQLTIQSLKFHRKCMVTKIRIILNSQRKLN